MEIFQKRPKRLLISQALPTVHCKYSGGQLRWDGNNVSFCVPPTIDIMKTNKGSLKSPIKMLQEMQKKINFFKNCWLLGLFWKSHVFGKWAWQASNGGHAYLLDYHCQWISMRKPSWKFHSKILTGFTFEKPTFSKKALKTNKFW